MPTGVIDTGAADSFIREADAKAASLEVTPDTNLPALTMANGSTYIPDRSVDLGGSVAPVAPAAANASLLSAGDLCNRGGSMYLNSKESWIFDPGGKPIIPLHYCPSHRTWTCTIEDWDQIRDWPALDALGHHVHIEGAVAYTSKRKASILQILISLHRRMGHPPYSVMRMAILSGAWQGSGLTEKDLPSGKSPFQCPACIFSKSNAIPHPSPATPVNEECGGVVSMDPFPVSIAGTQGQHYVFMFHDQASSLWHAECCDHKRDFVDQLNYVIRWYTLMGHPIKFLRSDAEILLHSKEAMLLLEKHGIRRQSSAPYQHHQVSAERHIQSLVKRVSTLLYDQPFLRAKHWPYAVKWIVDTWNRTPCSRTPGSTPWTVFSEETVDVGRMYQHHFGDLLAVGVPKELRSWRFDTRRDLGIFLGHPEGNVNSSYVYFPYEDAIKIRGDCIPLDLPPEDLASFFCAKAGFRGGLSSWSTVNDLLQYSNVQEKLLQAHSGQPTDDGVQLVETDATLPIPAHSTVPTTIVHDARNPPIVPAATRSDTSRSKARRVCRDSYRVVYARSKSKKAKQRRAAILRSLPQTEASNCVRAESLLAHLTSAWSKLASVIPPVSTPASNNPHQLTEPP